MALAAGCSSSSSGGSGGNTHGLHLTYTLWDPVQEVGYKKSIALLEKSHPGISVNVEQIPYPDYEAKLTSEFSSGSGPDVFWVNTPFLAQFEQAGVMLNLKPLITTNQDVSLFTKGKVAMDVEGDWFTQTIKTQAKFSFGVLRIPSGPDGRWNFTSGLIDAVNVHSPNQTAAWELERWLGSSASESIMGSGGYVWARHRLDRQHLPGHWEAKGVDVSPFLAEAENSGNVETLPAAREAGQVIVSPAADLGPAWLDDEPVPRAVATAARDANQEIQHPSQ